MVCDAAIKLEVFEFSLIFGLFKIMIWLAVEILGLF